MYYIHRPKVQKWAHPYGSFTIFLSIFTIQCLESGSSSTLPSCDEQNFTNGVCLADQSVDYLHFEPPRPWPVSVEIEALFSNVFNFDLDEGTITLQMSIQSWWNDTRLYVQLPDYYEEESVSTVPISEHIASEIWNPKIDLLYTKSNLKISTYLKGAPPNTIEYYKKILVTAWCNTTHINEYPFDHYLCEFYLSSLDDNYVHKVNISKWLIWDGNEKNDDFDISFSVGEIITWEENQADALQVDCIVERNPKGRRKVLNFFATTSLVASLSLISFFVPRENVPGRLGVLATLYLLLINLYRTTQTPRKIEFGYVDQWFNVIQVPILLGVIEYGFILAWEKYCGQRSKLRLWNNRALKYIDLIAFTINVIYLITVINAFKFIYD